MLAAAESLEFETAAELRDRIDAIKAGTDGGDRPSPKAGRGRKRRRVVG